MTAAPQIGAPTAVLRERAPAKVNLALHIRARREDGYHDLDSLVAFAGCAADTVILEPGRRLELVAVDGPFARAAGSGDDNLVLKAARAAASRIEGLRLGAFALTKRIPVAAGLGGGSADAGAALRLIARANDLTSDDPRLVQAAAATGADVPACLHSRGLRMGGVGERISLIHLPPLAAVLANPLRPLPTRDVFAGLGLAPGGCIARLDGDLDYVLRERFTLFRVDRADDALDALGAAWNDLEPPARALMPEIGLGLDALAHLDGCRLARMSGSGATIFGLFDDQRAARRAARILRAALPNWWVTPSMLR